MAQKAGKALVVGAGISGIRAALDLAETGYGVTLIDKAPHLGGILSKLDRQFPTNGCGMCRMLPLVARDQSSQFCLRRGLFHENITLMLSTHLNAVDGEPGKFSVKLNKKPSWIDPRRCMGCGDCVAVCPVEVKDGFNEGLGFRKAVYLPVPHSLPNAYVIDSAACNHCGACAQACPVGAIQLAFEKRRHFSVLVVDDEQIVRDSLKEWIEEEGFAVDSAASGPEALDKLGRGHVDLMLTDIKMPGMDGVDLLEKALEAAPGLCVLMMTAYATVETAVEALKKGARDYLIKPFDPEALVARVVDLYDDIEAGDTTTLDVGTILFCGGTDYYHPADHKNVYGYGQVPHVVTNLELERILSGTGPTQGKLVRPLDGRPVRKIAWLQCVGSRDLQCEADFCSSVCCMIALKEALLAKELDNDVETCLFYMDMRTFGKSFQRYRDAAERDHRVRFERARVHSVTPDTTTGDPVIRYVRTDGSVNSEVYDMVVLSVGQRPSDGNRQLAELVDAPLTPFGFVETEPFSPVIADNKGILAGGAFTGLKDIGDAVLHASSAALEASRTLHAAGGSLAVEPHTEPERPSVAREEPRVLIAVCTCGGRLAGRTDPDRIKPLLARDPDVSGVVFLEHACTQEGWQTLKAAARDQGLNRLLLAACQPYLFAGRLKALARELALDPDLMDVVDLLTTQRNRPPAAASPDASQGVKPAFTLADKADRFLTAIQIALARLKAADPLPVATVPGQRSALVVGGGIAGMQAALAIADHGYPVTLVEKEKTLGGNLGWLHRTLEGHPLAGLLADSVQAVAAHPLVSTLTQASVTASFGEAGGFCTTIEGAGGQQKTLQHGTVILATGGGEAATRSYGFGDHPCVITQKELEIRLGSQEFKAEGLQSVVMIQCVDARREPRNYCSRVCCPTSLKHALQLKAINPDIAVTVLYRDMMTPGFQESYFTEARKKGVIFVQYDPQHPPGRVPPASPDEPLYVAAVDPLLGRPLHIRADLLVLATGIVPQLPPELAACFGADVDPDGFFREADAKWRPVDSLKEGVFACGIALSPRSIPDAMASARAAAQRCLRILAHKRVPAGKIVATVRHALCSRCERCIGTCPYGARSLDIENDRIRINPIMCQGCGDCATVCPNSAAVVQGFADRQVMEMIDAALN